MRAFLLTRYGYEGSSSRYRIFQFISYLQSTGIDCVVTPFFGNNYLNHRFTSKQSMLLGVLSSFWCRLRALRHAKKFDVMFVQGEFFPFMPFAFERSLLTEGVPCVYDYDDALFHKYDQHPNRIVRTLLSNKIAHLIEGASGVIVGSRYLANYASQFNDKVYLIPTSIDLARYPATLSPSRSDIPFRIGWIGSPSTTVFLKEVEQALTDFCSRHKARVVLIGAGQEHLRIPNLTRLRWTEETEVEEISRFDVGIMPLSDTPFTRGKCAFKLIQYMGCWKPVIASPVGENVKVVEDRVNGFLADSPIEWIDALERLYVDSVLRHEMGRAGRAKVEREYSLHVTAPRVAEVLRCAVEEKV